MVLFSSSSFGGEEQAKGETMAIKLKKDLYEKDGKYVESDGHPKEWAGQGCHLVARAGTELSEKEAKEYGIAKESKAKAPKENKSK